MSSFFADTPFPFPGTVFAGTGGNRAFTEPDPPLFTEQCFRSLSGKKVRILIVILRLPKCLDRFFHRIFRRVEHNDVRFRHGIVVVIAKPFSLPDVVLHYSSSTSIGPSRNFSNFLVETFTFTRTKESTPSSLASSIASSKR